MANWPPPPPSAPPHGLPFHPGYPAQNGQSMPSNGASFQNLPHFPPQTSQPTPNALAFQQNASFPPVNLADIDPAHVAAVVQQMFNGRGQFPLPPPPPQSGFPPVPPPPIPFGFPPPANLPVPIPPQQMQTPLAPANHHPLPNTPVPNNRVMEIANGDKEEGELSDEPEPSGRVADSRHSLSAPHGRTRDDRSAAGGDFYRPGKDGVAPIGSDSLWTRNNRPVEHVRTDMEHDAGFDRYSSSTRPRSPRLSTYGDAYSSTKSRGDDSRCQSRTDQWRRTSGQHEYASQQHRNGTDSRPDEQPRQKAAPGVQSSGTDSAPAQSNKQQAEHFLRVLSACGFSLNDVKINSALDPEALEDVWHSLGLPVNTVESAKAQAGLPHPPPKQIDTSSRAANVSLPAKPPAKAPETKSTAAPPAPLPRPVVPPAQGSQKPEEKTTVGTSVSSRNSNASVASPPADRAAYIARLMAAKKNTSASANKTATSAATPAPAPESRTAAAVSTQPTPGQTSAAKVASNTATPSQSMLSQTAPLPSMASPAAQSQPPAAPTTQTSTSQISSDHPAQSAAPSNFATSGAPSTSQQSVEQKEPSAVDPAVLAAQKKQAQNELVRKRIEQLKLQRSKADAEEAARAKAQAAVASAMPNLRGGPAATGAALSQQMRASANLPARPAPLQTATPMEMAKTPVQDAQAPPSAASPAGGIPGLMLTAPSVSQPFIPASSTPVSAGTPAKGRKRPVAADFDDVKPATPSAFKRPFGQSRYETGTEMMIIEVSDDEGSIDDTNEADYQLQHPSRVPTQPQLDSSKQNATPGHYTPTAIDLPRPGFGRVNSAQPTPSASQTPGSIAHADSLRRKEEEIALLKRKLEERQRNLKSKNQPSRTGTPVNSGPATQVSTPARVASPVTAPGSANGAAPSTMSPLTRALADPPPAAGVRERSGSLLVDSSANGSPAPSDWKTRRRAEIESGLTAYDADMSKNMSRLEQLRREMEQLEEENRRRQKEKNDLANELEGLGIDTEGMAHEELQAKKDEIMLQKEEENREAEAAATQDVQEQETVPAEPLDTTGENSLAATVENVVEENLLAASPAIEQSQAPGKEPVQDTEDRPDSAPSDTKMSEGESEDEPDKTDAEMDMSDSEVEGSAAQEPRESTESGEVSEDYEPEQPTETKQLEEGEDSEDFYSPEPVPRAPTPEGADEAMDIASNSSSDESSDEDEEEYTPPDTAPALEEHTSPQTTTAQPVQGHVLTNGDDASSEAMDEGEDDDYEPSDALPATAQAPSASSPSEGSESKLEVENPSSRILRLSASKSGSEAPSQTPEVTIIADDVAPELQSRPAEQTRDSAQAPSVSDIKKQAFFTPYDSPLKMFKAYRYHPAYTDNVSGGFKSLTYSHDIDPMKPICPFEAAGGICNDPECDGQHFRGMGISEDKILLQLGIVNPGRTQEDQDLWRAGLRQILKSLREQGVKSGEAVAKAIADYRREFLRDPTRVLNL
ncbi:hypothetical protein HDK64DRAFT_310912 [Phyllosticta capitalensis]